MRFDAAKDVAWESALASMDERERDAAWCWRRAMHAADEALGALRELWPAHDIRIPPQHHGAAFRALHDAEELVAGLRGLAPALIGDDEGYTFLE